MTAVRAAVTGATGFIGRPLVRHLVGLGWAVRGVGRRPAEGGDPAVPWAVADLSDPPALAEALDDADVVFHLAALVDDGRPRAADDFHRVNEQGTRHVLAAAPAARVVVFSSISVYGPGNGGSPFTEQSPPAPRTAYAASKLAAERAAGEHPDAVVLRLAATYGPGMTGNYARLGRAVARRRFMLVGDGTNRRTLVHVEDACRAAVAALEAPAGSLYNVTDGAVHSLREIVDTMAVEAGVPPPRWRLPATAANAGERAARWAARLDYPRLERAAAAVAKLAEDLAVSGEALTRDTSYAPRIGLDAGWRSVVQAGGTITG